MAKKTLYAVIVAGGSGTRVGADIPKQFLSVGGKPILRRTVEKFRELPFDTRIIIVLPEQYRKFWTDYCMNENYVFRHNVVSGGLTRFHSVKKALSHVPDGAVVAVHDGVRPFVPSSLIETMTEMVYGGCKALVPVVPLYDSIRLKRADGSSEAADRNMFMSVQTPQVFDSTVLRKAYEQPYVCSFTDDASVVEHMGVTIHTCEGHRFNIKITDPDDLMIAEFLAGESGKKLL